MLKKAREIMPDIGSRRALLLAVVFAAVVVILSAIGPGLGAMLFTLLPLAALFIALYFVVRWAVAAGPRDAGGPRREVRAGWDRDRRLRADAFQTRNPVAAGAYNPSGAIKRAYLW